MSTMAQAPLPIGNQRGPARPWRVATLVFLISARVSAALGWKVERERVALQREQALHLAQSHSQVLQRSVERMVSINYALAALVRQGNGDLGNFDTAAAQLLVPNPRLLALSVSPDGVVQRVVPRAGNEKLIGFDQLNDPGWGARLVLRATPGG